VLNVKITSEQQLAPIRKESKVIIHSIEATGMSGGFAYRYQYQTAENHYFGYTDTLQEAEAILAELQEGK